MTARGPDKRTYSGATEKTREVQQERKWQQKTDICRNTLEDDNDNGNEADKEQTEAAEKGGREAAASRARAGSLHHSPSGIRIPSCTSCICLEVEERELTVLTSE